MKKIFLFILILVHIPLNLYSYSTKIDGIYYDILTNYARVTYYERLHNQDAYEGDVVIPSSITLRSGKTYPVTQIGANAFWNCEKLKSVTIPNSVIFIGEGAFDYCKGLTYVNIPNSVEKILSYTFRSCENLESITIPNSIIEIYDNAFMYCNSLNSLIVEDGNLKYDSRDNCNAIIETATNSLVVGCNNTTIPNSVTSIGSLAFCGRSQISAVSIPESVVTIGNSAFADCARLYSVEFAESVTTISKRAFADCTSLSLIVCKKTNPPAIDANTFDGVNINDVTVYVPYRTIPKYKSDIYWRLFSYKWLEKENKINDIDYLLLDDNSAVVVEGWSQQIITIPGSIEYNGNTYSVTDIADGAFCSVENVSRIVLPSTITTIGCFALYCNYVTDVYCNATTPPVLYNANSISELTSIYVPVGAKSNYRNAPYWKEHQKLYVMEDHHDFGEVAWEWDGTESATAILICKNDAEEVFRAEAEVTSTDITPSTCTVKGVRKLTAKAVFNDLEGSPEYQTEKDVDIPLVEHTMTLVNNNDGTHSLICSVCRGNEHRESHSFIYDYCKACGAVSKVSDTDLSALSNVMYATKVSALAGNEIVMPICMNNTVPMTGFQFQISIPFVDLSGAEVSYSGAGPNISFRSALQGDGTIKVLCYSTDGEYLEDADGRMCTITVHVPEVLEQKDYPVTISDIRLTQGGTLYRTDDRVRSSVTIIMDTNNKLGDANGDDVVNVGDITAVASYILGQNPESFNSTAADANQDGNINVGDITTIAGMILGN